MWITDYAPEFHRRIKLYNKLLGYLQEDKAEFKRVWTFYKHNPVNFINDWCITTDPRVTTGSTIMPFKLFPRQVEFVNFVVGCLDDKQPGLIEKSRDVGATWLCCCISVWLWLFWPGIAVGWGSNKAENVDDRGNPKAIFHKLRQLVMNLPPFLRPMGFNPRLDMPFMKILHPYNSSTITGEGGDGIGRSGRTTIYFKDEALTLSSKILTMSGWKLMGELTMRDQVVSVEGKSQNITHINECGDFEIYTVTFNDGTDIECSPHHQWTLNEVIGLRKQVIIRTEEVFDRYKYVSPMGQIQYRFRLPIIEPVKFKKKKLPLHPYVIGALIGDGGMSQVPKHSPKLTSADAEIVDYFTACLPDYCVIKPDGKYGYRLGDVRGRMGWKHKSRIRQAVVLTGLAGKRSWEKYIPDMYKFSSINDRIELLHGLMDTDGSAGKSGGSAAYYTSSNQLANDVRFLAESLGGYATIKIKKDKRGFRDQYVVFVVLPDKFKPFRLKRKIDIYDKRKNSIERSIVSVKKTGRTEPVRCITVDSPDGLYLTEGCIPTHNSAHYERPDGIEAALSQNTNVQIDISSVNGTNNPFYRKRMAGELWYPDKVPPPGMTRIFIFDWRDNPLKDQAWYNEISARYERDGLAHIIAQEVDRNYGAAIDRIIIPPEWVNAAVDAHKVLKFELTGDKFAGQDVADEGGDRNALVVRHGVILRHAETMGGDPGAAAQAAIPVCVEYGVSQLYFDSIGVGAGFKVEINNLKQRGNFPRHLRVMPWNAGASPIDPDENVIQGDMQSPTNDEQYRNLKAQAWFRLRARFKRTYDAVIHKKPFSQNDLISLDSTIPKLHALKNELSQAQYKSAENGKTMVDKKPSGASSPNLADAVVIAYNPCMETSIFDVL